MSIKSPARVEIRPGTVDDLPALTEIYNHYVVSTPISFEVEPHTVEARREWLSHYADQGRHRLLVATVEGAVAGYATSSPFNVRAAYDTSVEASVYCAPAARGQGLGSRLYTALFAALAEEDVHRVCAGVALPNEASVALHHRFGFTDVGVFHQVGRKFGRYWDVLWMEKGLRG